MTLQFLERPVYISLTTNTQAGSLLHLSLISTFPPRYCTNGISIRGLVRTDPGVTWTCQLGTLRDWVLPKTFTMSYDSFPVWCQARGDMSNIGNPSLAYVHLSAAKLTRFIINYPLGIFTTFEFLLSSIPICWAKAWWESFVAGDISLFKCQTCHHNVIISLSLGDKMSDRWERFVIWILSWICTGECSVHCESSKYLSAGRASGRTVPDLIISYKYLSSQQSWRIGQIKINDWTDVSFKWYQKYSLGLARRCWAVLLPRPPSETLLA